MWPLEGGAGGEGFEDCEWRWDGDEDGDIDSSDVDERCGRGIYGRDRAARPDFLLATTVI